MKAIITKLQDMKPLYLDATKESYIMKLETNKYVIVHSFFDNELRIIPLSKYSSYSEYLEFAVNNEDLEVETKKEVLKEKISMSKNVMQALLLAKKEVSNIMETINQVINFSIQALDYSFVVITALILSLFFSSKAKLETNKDNKTSVLSYSQNAPSVKRFYFVLKLVNISFIMYLVIIKSIDNLLIG